MREKTIIHVNQHVIRHNKKYENTLPPCRVETNGNPPRYAMEVHINGPSSLLYMPDNPMPCGAKLWIETYSDVMLIGEKEYKDIKNEMDEITKR